MILIATALLFLFLFLLAAVLFPRFGILLLLLGLVACADVLIYGNLPRDPGAGETIGRAILGVAAVVWVGGCLVAVGIGVALRRGLGALLPPWVEAPAAALAATVPAGALALGLGHVLSGAPFPLAVHLGLLGLWALIGLAGRTLPSPWNGGVIGLALWMAVITADSMGFEARVMPGAGACLSLGGQDPAAFRPLMALTVPKPVLRMTGAEVRRWSFRFRSFVDDAPFQHACPAPPTLP